MKEGGYSNKNLHPLIWITLQYCVLYFHAKYFSLFKIIIVIHMLIIYVTKVIRVYGDIVESYNWHNYNSEKDINV